VNTDGQRHRLTLTFLVVCYGVILRWCYINKYCKCCVIATTKILHEEFHWIYLPGEIKLLLVTVNNRLILEIEIVHNLSCHPIGWEWVEIVPLILCSHGLHETVASLYCVIFSLSPACSFCSERCLCDCEQLKLLVASVFHVWLTFVTRNKWSKLLIQRWRDLEELTSWSTMPVQSSSPTLLIPAWRDMISWCRSTLVGHIYGKYHASFASQLLKFCMLFDYMLILKHDDVVLCSLHLLSFV